MKRLSREYKLKGIEPQSYRSYFRNFDLITEIRKDGNELHQLLNARAAGTLAVFGYIEGANPDEVVVLGAHYDQVRKYNRFIFNGTDDNASGIAVMLTLARAYAESGRKPEKTIVFAAWTGEEQGLWGSK